MFRSHDCIRRAVAGTGATLARRREKYRARPGFGQTAHTGLGTAQPNSFPQEPVMPTPEPPVTPKAPAPPAANRPEGKTIEEVNRETLPKTPDGKVVDPKQKEAEGSAS
jgi:hypothetical protein